MRACHKLVRSIAQEACGNLYEVVMSRNDIHAEWKRQNPQCTTAKQLESLFIVKNWPQCIEFARATMAMMLGRSDISDHMKHEIYEALILDNKIPVGRGVASTAAFVNQNPTLRQSLLEATQRMMPPAGPSSDTSH